MLAPNRTKTKVTHRIPLAPEAVAVIEDAKRRRGFSATYLLSHTGQCAITNFGRVVWRLKRAIDGPPIEGFVLHDFRAALVSNLAERGFDPVMLDRLLGHQPAKLSRIASIYQRAERRDEIRSALETWADLLTQTAEVVDLVKKRG
jgi:integrase